MVDLYYWGNTLVEVVGDRVENGTVLIRTLERKLWVDKWQVICVFVDHLAPAGPHIKCPVVVELCDGEIAWATEIGQQIMKDTISKGSSTKKYGKQPSNRRELDNIMGYLAELAVSKLLQLPWNPTMSYLKKSADIGRHYQIRYAHSSYRRLIVRPNDSNTDLFVFVTGNKHKLTVWGCIEGKKAKQVIYLDSPSNRPQAYFIPKENLTYLPA